MIERRRRAPEGAVRRLILGQAARLATVEGLEGLSIRRLAEATGMPKSSVYVLFGSGGAAAGHHRRRPVSFLEEVVTPALRAVPPGRERLEMLCEGFLGYVQRRVFPSRCFFVATAAELGARRGRVDRVAAYQREWHDLLEQTAPGGRRAGRRGRPGPAGLRAVGHPGRGRHRGRPARRRQQRHRPRPARRHGPAGARADGAASVANWTRPGSGPRWCVVGWFERPEFGANVGLIDEIYRQYLDNPSR